MVDSDDAHVVDLRDDSDDDAIRTTDTVRTRRTWLAPGLGIAAAAAIVALILLGDDIDRPDPPASPEATAEPAAEPTSSEDADGATGPAGEPSRPGGATPAIPPVDTAMTLVLATEPIDGSVVDFVRVDSATGAATFLDNRSLLGLAECDDIRFFGPDKAVAQLVDGSYLTLAVGAESVEIVTLVDVTATASATPLGLEMLSPDGRIAWVASPFGFFEWDLGEDRIVGRWLDRDGDLDRLPRARLALESGLVVEAGANTYLIEGTTAQRLALDGEVVAGAGDWVLTRQCSDRLDCGDLELVDLASSATVALVDERFRERCGLMAPVPPGSVGGTNAVVVVANRDGVSSLTPLHPLPVGCIDASVLDDGRMVVFSDTTIAYVDGDGVAVVTTFALGRTLAGTAGAARQ